jgi:hypothetical protein
MPRSLTTLALLAALAGPSARAAAGSDSEIAALRAEVARLRDELRRERGGDWLTEARAEEIRSLVHEVLADADTRASLLQGGPTAGYNKGFFIGTDDGAFKLLINGQVQVRWAYNTQDNGPSDDHRWGFESRRTKLSFKGHVVDSSWEYLIGGAFERGDGGPFILEDAEVKKKFGNGAYLRFGQFKGPFLREELISSRRLLAVERSLINERFNQDRSQGVELGWQCEQVRFMGMYSDGHRTASTPALDADTEFSFMARAELLALGAWDQFNDFTTWSGEEQGVLVGGGVNYEKDEYGSAAGPEEETFRWTVDGSLEASPLNVYAAVAGVHREQAGTDEFGFVIQGGYHVVPDEWEVFGRFEWGDDDVTQELQVITVGVNRYFRKHDLKWTTDVGIALEEVSDSWDSSGAAWRRDSANQDGQVVVRSQFQLLF